MADFYEDLISGSPVVLPVVTENTTFTPTLTGFGTAAAVLFHYRRVGSSLHLTGRFASGTATAVTASVSLPSGLTVGNIGGSSGAIIIGKWARQQVTGTASSLKQGTLVTSTGATTINFAYDDYTNTDKVTTALNGSSMVASGEVIFFDGEIVIPIAEWAGSANVAYGAGLATSVKSGLVAPMGNEIDLTSVLTVPGTTGLIINRAVGQAYSDANGVWRMKFNIVASFTAQSTASIGISLAGTVFKNSSGFLQPVSGFLAITTQPARCYVAPNTGNILVTVASAANTDAVYASGDVELNAKPSWA